jgi:hypothetical protein
VIGDRHLPAADGHAGLEGVRQPIATHVRSQPDTYSSGLRLGFGLGNPTVVAATETSKYPRLTSE